MFYANRKINLLDRKFEFIIKLPPGDFLLELENFVHFVLTDETVAQYSNTLFYRFKRKNLEFSRLALELLDQLLEIRDAILSQHPHLDDSDIVVPDDLQDSVSDEKYFRSFAYFKAVSNKVKSSLPDEYPNDRIEKDISALEQILRCKFSDIQHNNKAEELFLKLNMISDSKVHLFRKIKNYHRTSPDGSLVALCKIAENINPSPHKYKSLADLGDTVIERLILSEYGAIQEVIYGSQEHIEIIELYKITLRRSYEGLRAEIGSRLTHYEILQRYKSRCTWYDRTRLEELIVKHEKQVEDTLTHDLALYLFDNGISTLYRLRRGVHEYDLIGHRTDTPIFIEAKVYKSSNNARSDLIRGVSQLHSYINSLESENLSITEIYYIIFRLGGPLYDLPWDIPTNRTTFYPIVIDLGPSKESGRRQSKPIQIPLKEFFSQIS